MTATAWRGIRRRALAAIMAAMSLGTLHTAMADTPPPDIPLAWLEDGASAATQAWVAERNAETAARVEHDPRFAAERQRFLALGRAARTELYLNGGLVHRIDSSPSRPLGRWQVQAASGPARRLVGVGWQTLLDLDALAQREGVRWKLPLWWKNPICDTTLGTRCVVALSPDGGDRTVLREFDLRRRAFVDGGFRIDTPARTYAHWVDADHLLVASDFGPGTLSTAAYARQARLWRRGTPLADARLVFDAPADAVLFIPHNFRHATGTLFVAEVWHQAAGAPSWWLMDPAGAPARRWHPPVDLVRYRGLTGIVDDRLVAVTAQPWPQDGGAAWPAGSVVSLPLPGRPGTPEAIHLPGPSEAVDPVFHLAVAQDSLWLGLMHDVSGQLVEARRQDGRWTLQAQPVPPHAAVRLQTGEVAPSRVLVTTESLTSPPTTTLRGGGPPREVARLKPLFDAAPFTTEQRFATSRDGTRVPYYVVRRRDTPADARPAALISAYGGFGISFLPAYLNHEFHSDLAWPMLQAGALYVHAGIRGGGEYGPGWHRAAQRRLRQNGFDDLVAVAEDLVKSGLADGRRLGFVGSSNGGLLAAATAVQRPDLLRAVIADVPLTDMLRFHELFTGAVWIDEYGDPREPEDRAALAAYSPLHQLREGVAYPRLLLTTSSSDDRVHPGHARRFAERLRQLGQPVLFHESTDAGHGAAASLASAAQLRALQSTFLLQSLDLK